MLKDLLLVTADTNFGQVLLYGLEQAGYSAHIVKGKGEAVVRADEKNCNLAFLDMELGAKAVVDIGKALRALGRISAWSCSRRKLRPPWMTSIPGC
jgi:ActR/RegA family two-component response regulator